jgi:hypothetical protein
MQKNSWIRTCAFLLGIVTLASGVSSSARADEPESAAPSTMPAREHDLVAILADAQKQYAASHTVDRAKDARIGMQERVIAFMRESQAAQDWVGTVQTRGTTAEGNAWIAIDIGGGATVMTWQNERDDLNYGTLLRQHAPLFAAARNAKIGQPVTFSGTILKSVLAKDEEMVTRPQFVARFSALKIAH